MKRPLIGLFACLALCASPAFAQRTPAETAQTAHALAAYQNPDGGFAAKVGGPSSLGTTSSVIRSLKNVGGSIPDVFKCIDYVKSCHDPKTGGFAPSPGGAPDVHTTAVGLMAVAELKIVDGDFVENGITYLNENAKTFEDVRIAVAGLESVGAKSPKFPAWTELVNSDRNADGTWGEGPGKAFATGGAAVALLRMGVTLDRKDAVLKAMRDGQNADGGWSDGDGPSNLGATYRIMRCFFMLKEAPDLDRLRTYLAKHRQSDGGYASKLDGTSDAGGAYFCTTVDRWSRLLSGEPAIVETAGFVPLFNGKSLDGWEGDTSLWSARDGVLIGRSKGLKQNEFLATTKSYRDFVLKLTFRLVGGEGNSGVQFRSVRVPGSEMSGYQADIGQNYWGCLYDESRRNKVLVQASKNAMEGVHKTGWNEYVLRVIGDHITLTLNGVRSVDYRETDPEITRDGKIAVQMHAGGPIEVQFKDIYIQELPSPTADDSMKPGFHLRTLKGDDADRKYTVYLPEGYDGNQAFPVVLFLHGSGERGSDGVLSAQVGLGAVIPAHPGRYPFIGVFPQARETWKAGSDDAKAALTALDDVFKTYKCDHDRIVLTGLSMGGSGSWSIGAAHPERFSAIVPVCGSGDPEGVGPLKNTPVWTLMGDADSGRVVQPTRDLVRALRAAGGSVRETEYRGVGHNSWDRAYSDRELIDWMLAQKRAAK